MDTENNDFTKANNASYDPDAAELLKDLEDDEDDEDYSPDSPSAQVNQSIVNILTSSYNLESFTTSPML